MRTDAREPQPNTARAFVLGAVRSLCGKAPKEGAVAERRAALVTGAWSLPAGGTRVRPWTDDDSSVLQVFRG